MMVKCVCVQGLCISLRAYIWLWHTVNCCLAALLLNINIITYVTIIIIISLLIVEYGCSFIPIWSLLRSAACGFTNTISTCTKWREVYPVPLPPTPWTLYLIKVWNIVVSIMYQIWLLWIPVYGKACLVWSLFAVANGEGGHYTVEHYSSCCWTLQYGITHPVSRLQNIPDKAGANVGESNNWRHR